MKINYLNVRRISYFIWGLGIAISLLGLLFMQPFQDILVILGIVLIVVSVIILLRFWRCPHCQGLLPLRSSRPRYCPTCGHRLYN